MAVVQKVGAGQKAEEEESDKKRILRYPPKPEPPKPVLESFTSRTRKYLEHCERRMARNTVRTKDFYYWQFAVYAAAHLGNADDFPAESVTVPFINSYLNMVHDWQGKKIANRHRKESKAFFAWTFKGIPNPVDEIDPFGEDEYKRYNPPAEDILAVILAANPEETDILETLFYTAGRASEIWRLCWNHVNFETRTITLQTRKRKGGALEQNDLPMSDTLHNLLMRRWQNRDKEQPWVFLNPNTGKPYTKDTHTTRYLMQRLCKRAGVKYFTFHCIRHHVAGLLRDNGKATLFEIQAWLRHKRPTTTQIYLKSHGPSIDHLTQVLDEKIHAKALQKAIKK